jgi:hypothetical protein
MSLRVLARDPTLGILLITGIGFAGRGTLWRADSAGRRRYPGYEIAPIVNALTTPDDRGKQGAAIALKEMGKEISTMKWLAMIGLPHRFVAYGPFDTQDEAIEFRNKLNTIPPGAPDWHVQRLITKDDPEWPDLSKVQDQPAEASKPRGFGEGGFGEGPSSFRAVDDGMAAYTATSEHGLDDDEFERLTLIYGYQPG